MSSGVLKGVLYVPDLGANLLSIGQWTASTGGGCEVHFAKDAVWLTRNKILQIRGAKVGNSLYHLNINAEPIAEDAALVSKPSTSLSIWHERLGHLNYTMLNKMRSTEAVTGFHVSPSCSATSTLCTGCIFGKMQRASFPSGRTRGINVGDIIHSDVCGPMSTPSPSDSRYFVLFKDDFSGWTTVRFLKHKSEVPETFYEFYELLKTETGQRIKILQSDNGGEFTGGEFEKWLRSSGVIHHCSAPHTPQQNGVSERANRTIVESTRSQMYGRKVNVELWTEAVASAAHVLNRTLSRTNNKTPYELWHGKKPNISYLRIFGSRAFVHLPDASRCKLDSKAVECIMVGYCPRSKAYRLWNPATRRIVISRDVIFDETISPSPVSVVEDPEQTEYHFDFPLSCGQQLPEVYS